MLEKIFESPNPSPLIPLPIGWGEGISRWMNEKEVRRFPIEHPRPIRWGEGLRERVSAISNPFVAIIMTELLKKSRICLPRIS
jgi:hypothetical protein